MDTKERRRRLSGSISRAGKGCATSRALTRPGEMSWETLRKKDHHLERDHWGKQEMLKIEKLPKSSSSPGNNVRGEAKHAKESL